MNNSNNFDFVRFLLASLVIVFHSVPLTGNGISYMEMFTNHQLGLGEFCVNEFFVISGYLIVASYIRVNNLLKYLISRVLRIIPALIFLIIITVFIVGPIVSDVPVKIYMTSPLTYSYLKNMWLYNIQYSLTGFDSKSPTIYHTAVNGSLWTLPIEFFCYIIIAFLGSVKLLNKYIALAVFGVSLLLYVNFNAIFYHSNQMFSHQIVWGSTKIAHLLLEHFFKLPLENFFRLTSYFFIGSCFYFYSQQVVFKWQYCLLSSVFILLACKIVYNLNLIFPICGSYILFYFVFHEKIKIHSFARFGDFSYGIYIYGFLIQQLVIMGFNGRMSSTLNYVISLPIAIFMGVLSYHLIEKHFMKFKRYFIK